MGDHVDKDDYNLQETWDRVCQSFAKTTGVSLTATSKYTVDEVLEQIRSKQDENDERNAKYKVAKEVISKTLDCITILGGIAAQGASMVFGPSALCFNAVSYLIQTGSSYKRIFSSLAELFKRISDVLERCKIYLRMPPESVDIALRRIINDELLCFVDICALSMKVLKGHKIFIALKVFAFNSDEGVSARLGYLAELVEREAQMRGTLGFESQKQNEKNIAETKEGTKRVNANVDKLLEFEKKKDAESTEKKQLNDIDAILDSPSKTYKTVQATYKKLLSKKVEGSGEWLRKDPVYSSWSTTEQSSFSVLGISGAEGYGKSFLFATAIRDLQERYSQVSDDLSCASAGYYFFEQDRGTQSAEKDASSLVKALKVLAWQIADKDLVFRKDLAASAKSMGGNQIKRAWDLLFAKSYKTDSAFFLLFDGVDQIDKEDLKQFIHLLTDLKKISTTWGKFSLRILVSGRVETLDRIKSNLEEGASIINVASKNGDDIEKFITDRLDRMDILSGSSAQVVSLKKDILETLTKEAHGDFINIGLLLDEISAKQRPGEIREVLSRSGEKRSDTIARKIDRLNETLSDNDISDLNELLVWVMHSLRPITLEELEAVLFLKNGEPSLRSLADEINDRYSSLFRVVWEPDPLAKVMPPGATVSLVSDSIQKYFQTKAENEAASDAQGWDNRNGTTVGDVTESEVRIVRRFLDMVCDAKLFKKFDFETFFEKKLNKRTAGINVDLDTAHLKILTTCLQTIYYPKESEEVSPLRDYATWFFGLHLNNVDLSLASPHSKAVVGVQLVKLFNDEEVIQKWWTDESLDLRFLWLYQDVYADATLKWLQDSAVTKRLSEDDRKWIKSLSSKSEPDADLLQHVAKFLAHKWLQDDTWDLVQLFLCVHGYLTKITNLRDTKVKRSKEDPDGKDVKVFQIQNAAEWVRQLLGIETFGYKETRNLARTFRDFGKLHKAIDTFKLALTLKSDNWLAQWGLADTYQKLGDYDLAIEMLERVKSLLESGEAKEDVLPETISYITEDLALWHKEAGKNEKALEFYELMLKEKPDDYDTAVEIMSILRKAGEFGKLLEFFETLKKSKDEVTGLDRRTQIFHVQYWNPDYHETISAAGYNLKSFDILKESYQTAIDAAESNVRAAKEREDRVKEANAKGILASLTHYFAQFFSNNFDGVEEKEFAISLWARVLQMEDVESVRWSYLPFVKERTTSKLASFYFKEAQRAGQDAEKAATYIDHLAHLAVFQGDEGISESSKYPKQLLARYYSLRGEAEMAKDALRAFVKTNLDLLSDDDPDNDWQGYEGLTWHFMFAGQDDNCLAAWSLITPTKQETEDAEPAVGDQSGTSPSDESEESPESTESAGKEPVGPLWMYCDGRCGTSWTYSNDIYLCRECNDCVAFDECCLKKLREGTLEKQVCNKNHEMFHVPKYDEDELKRIGEGNVKVGQEILKVEDWIQRLKEDWGLAVSG